MAASTPVILPVPQSVIPDEGSFHLDEQTLILLLPRSGSEAYVSAVGLQAEIAAATGLTPPILRVTRPPRRTNVIVLCDDATAAGAYLGVELPDTGIAGHGPQAYVVSISPQIVLAGGEGLIALHHAVQTLRQITRRQGTSWGACRIDDWPALKYRGVMLDVSRGKVPTLATLKEIVDCLSLFKMNVLQLYTEHTFDYVSHPRIGLGTDPLTSEDMLALDAYARERHVELMPNLNSFGHCAHLLSLTEYAHLAESAVPWTLTPVDEGTYTLLGDMLDDLLPGFSSRTFNAGCDETWDLGKGRSATLAAEIGVGRVYLHHLQRLHTMAQERGYRIQFWGDILLHHPELVPEVPADVTLLDWHYESQESYPSLDVFAESGRPFWVCPGTSSWNTLFPRMENSNGNIRKFVRQGAERGAEGMLNTDWGDHGHYQPLGLSWYAYVYGAAQAWSGGVTADDLFDACFGPLWFGEKGGQVVSAIRALGRLNELEGMPRNNSSNSITMLLEEPLGSDLAATVPAETLDAILAVTGQAETVFRSAWEQSRDGLSLEEMIHSARWMAYAARKLRASQQIRVALTPDARDLPAAAADACETLRVLELELVPLTSEFVRLWRLRARDSEIRQHLGALDALRERFGLARQWLGSIASGERDTLDVQAYLAANPRYEILGQAFWRQMREVNAGL
ncbi:MAG: family 20 glycosylhydrolase [Anaerolineae bacterium]